jgi:CheY-like chemotaxis protein
VCQDITERTELRAQVAQAQTMAALGRLAGGIGHDFNNLLQVLEGYTATLMAGTSADTARQADLQQIRSVGERAGKLTQQLLALGGRHPLRLRAVDLPALVAQMLPSLTEAVGERIQVEFAAQVEGTCVQADAAALEQTVRELCLYGRDTMPHGGRLRLRITEVVADAQFQRERPWADRGRYLLLTVTDTGPGLTPAERERIFEPFFAADRGSAARNLGLAAVRGLVTQQGGMIEAHATPGRGTGFHVYLPVSATEPALGTVAAASAAVPRPAGGRPTVLFAEDDLAVCELASRTLREAGYDVLVAHDGAQALACFDARQGRVDVIVLDMVMPMLGGERVCEEIARRDPAARIILTSGYDAEALGEWEGCRREGLLLQKPYPPARLVSAVRDALAGSAG